ncbi:nucleotidyltransferase family protein [Chitinophaga pinensis]|uniref:Nucleotidyltransferase family protein n=1 Tax=Chitinophaga pinensis TaxID=79329 RepID=A0A5C6LKL8_9BACT|nr:nucleotidyltransferase family protein [Chitinophaga pinensis]TWV93293.1 nucleotidyltransferase family protein [Chitinophaga pinensis]
MLNNEVTVVVLCCKVYLQTSAISDLKTFICQHPIQWQQVYQLSTKHRVRPLVFQILSKLPAEVPADILQRFRAYCREFLLFAVDRHQEAARVVHLLAEQGIAARHYKGTDYALLLYRDIGMREFTDIDIVIDSDQADRVRAIMQAEGYEMYLEKYFRKYPAHFRRHIKEVNFGKRCPRGKRFSFEFHYRPTHGLMDLQYSFADLLGPDYLQRAYTAGDYYTLMVLNNGASDFFPHLRSLMDMILLYRKGPFSVPAALRPYELLWQQLAASLLGFKTEAAPAHDATYQLLADRLRHSRAGDSYTLLQQARVRLSLAADISAKWRITHRYLTYLLRPNANDINALPLPYFLYYFTKPVRLASNLLKVRK